MLGFTEVENRIIKEYISDIKLSRSLSSIRELMEHIWTNDVRIVRDYTDHGIEHSERVSGFVEKLLQVNPNLEFSEQEIYLLLAGVYLHDIGMQCDVVKYPYIKEKARVLGADLNKAFTSKTTNGYSKKEQKEIRDNHHYLSAAWIDYLYEELHPAIKSIPDDLLEDLMDVCKFHSSKLLINNCGDTFRLNENHRKRMVAALLRFADELDISSSRVELETVKLHNFPPENSMYWWLHNYTKVIFVESNSIKLSVRLHPEDIKLCGDFIREKYIANFKSKNQLVLDVLVKHKIYVVVDNNSGIVEHIRAERFPSYIKNLVLSFTENTSSLETNISSSEIHLPPETITTISSEAINKKFTNNKALDANTSSPETHLPIKMISSVIDEPTNKINSPETYNTYQRNFIKKYIGEGFLKSEDKIELPCKFETWQSENGEITLICNCSILDMDVPKYFPELNLEKTSPVELKVLMAWSIYSSINIFQQFKKFRIFSGFTTDGSRITGEIGNYFNTNSESLRDDTPRIKFEYYVKELTVNRDSKENLQCVRFGVTNFKFTGNESQGNILTLDLKGAKRLTIEKKNEYEGAIEYLENFKGVRVTSEISVEIDNDAEIKKSEDLANDLCELMSIACGTRVIWIYCYGYNTEGEIVSRFHRSSATRPYQPMQLIRNDYIWLKSFLEDSYAVYVDKQELLRSNKYIINAYLDGKAQNDYLEQRGIKLAVITGLFTELFLSLKPEREHIIEAKEFNMLKSKLEEVFKEVLDHSVDLSSRDKINQYISGCVSGVNRTPFNELLSDFCEYIGLKEDNLQSIIDSKNKLIHKGKFICQTYEDKSKLVQEYPNFKDPWSEYSYSLNFVDKCILKLLGYKGYYINQNNFKEEELL